MDYDKNVLLFTDCESLIRKMLVLEPMKRYTIEQIKKHRWMAGEPYVTPSLVSDSIRSPAHQSSHHEPNEQVLKLMHSLGIDPVKTKEVNNVLKINALIKLSIFLS